MNDNNEELPHNFDDFLESLDKDVEDTFRTFGLMFETTIDEKSRENVIKNSMTERRSNVRGVSDEILENQNTFYVIAVFLKLLNELGFQVEETLDETWDFCGSMLLDDDQLQVSVEFKYGQDEVEYEVMYNDERELKTGTGAEDLLDSIFNGGWDLPRFNSTLSPIQLYDDLEEFMTDFRSSWSEYKKNTNIKST